MFPRRLRESLAHRLQTWADVLSSQVEEPADDSAELPTETSAASEVEPPAHWLQLTQRSRPPAHWLETVLKSAPSLLDPEMVPTLKVAAPMESPESDQPVNDWSESIPNAETDREPDFGPTQAASPALNTPDYGLRGPKAIPSQPQYERRERKPEAAQHYQESARQTTSDKNDVPQTRQPKQSRPEHSVDWPLTSSAKRQEALAPTEFHTTRRNTEPAKPVEPAISQPRKNVDSPTRRSRKFQAVPLEVRPTEPSRKPAKSPDRDQMFLPRPQPEQISVDYSGSAEGHWLPLPDVDLTEDDEGQQPQQEHLARLESEQRGL